MGNVLRLRPRLVCCAAIIFLAFYPRLFALQQAPHPGPRPIGVGAYPLSFVHASAWFAHRGDSQVKEVTVMVYLEGKPGWQNRTSQFKSEINGNPARIEMNVGDSPVQILYWPDTFSVEIRESKYDLRDTNVFLVQGIDDAMPTIKALGLQNLRFRPDDNPATALLQRDADLRAALIGSQPQEAPPVTAPAELVALDAEGLRLLESDSPQDQKKGCELFRKAALAGYAGSQYRLGYCYESGLGVKQNYVTANQWYEKAANQGYVDAQYKLGHSYRVGRGTNIDLQTALEWYKKAAANGDAEGMHNVGWMYATGQGVESDAQQAYSWFLKAAEAGEPAAQLEVARRLKDGDGTAPNLADSYAWLLVLQAQKQEFAPTAWISIEEMLKAVEANLDDAARTKADKESQDQMRHIDILSIEKLAPR